MNEAPPPPHLSVVVPAFNEQSRISNSLKRIGDFLLTLGYSTEIVVVDDGSGTDGQRAVEAALKGVPAGVAVQSLRHEVNRGKGAAVRTGCLAARGDYVAFIDADLATPPEDLPRLISALDAGADVAIGIRRQSDGSDMRNARGLARRLAGKAFSLAMQTLLLPGVADSQCPLKSFRREAARRIFSLQSVDTWAFDAEVLFLASRMGMRLAKVPVRWQAVQGSHLRLNAKSAMELWNLVRIRWDHRGVSERTLEAEPAAGR